MEGVFFISFYETMLLQQKQLQQKLTDIQKQLQQLPEGKLQTVDKVLRETSVSRSIFLCVYEIYSENRKFSLGLCHP